MLRPIAAAAAFAVGFGIIFAPVAAAEPRDRGTQSSSGSSSQSGSSSSTSSSSTSQQRGLRGGPGPSWSDQKADFREKRREAALERIRAWFGW